MALATDSQSGVCSGRRRVQCSGRRCGVEGRARDEKDAGWWQMATTDALAFPWGPHRGLGLGEATFDVAVAGGQTVQYPHSPRVAAWGSPRRVTQVADIVFAFDPAIDRPLAVPNSAHAAVTAIIGRAAAESFSEAVAVARRGEASVLVVCGRWLDPLRASPAQAAMVRSAVRDLAAVGCRTVFMTSDATTCHDMARMLGEPQGLFFATPAAPLTLDIHGIAVEFVAVENASGIATIPLDPPPRSGAHRRVVLGWDTTIPTSAADDSGWPGDHDPASAFVHAAAASPAWTLPGAFWIWASRRRPALPSGICHLPPLQPRSPHERVEGGCCTLTLVDRAAAVDDHTVPADWRASWRDIPTQRVGWRTVKVESSAGGDEELATALWQAIEQVAPGEQAPLELVRCIVECGTSVSHRVRVGEVAAETLARLRDLFDPKAFRAWCVEVMADPGESLAPLGHARSGGRPGTTTSFTSALADIVQVMELDPAAPISPTAARQAGWVALELIEST